MRQEYKIEITANRTMFWALAKMRAHLARRGLTLVTSSLILSYDPPSQKLVYVTEDEA